MATCVVELQNAVKRHFHNLCSLQSNLNIHVVEVDHFHIIFIQCLK